MAGEMKNRFQIQPAASASEIPAWFDESKRVKTEGEYWDAVCALNKSTSDAAAIATVIRIASGKFGSVSQWAIETLRTKLSIEFTAANPHADLYRK